jgi:hypothetical protein
MTLPNNAPKPTLGDVLDALLAEFPHLKRREIISPSRRRTVAWPRMMAMALSRELGGQSYPRIGRFYDGRDHTTVMHAVRRIAELCAADREMEMTLAAMRRRIMAALSGDQGASHMQRVRQAVQSDPALRASAERAAAREQASRGDAA